ncbi:MAG: UDP-N-acetylmuramoyl-L-alanine--D-glutamate ligase [Pseudobutyrivibrio sp.]|nr:UDP-N-acetylmuramoyl-L-alanine--D-glutamate ligase [Pseudobutyrivibrio sp.]
MKATIKNLVINKKVLILGFGREGQSSFRLVDEVGGYACLDIADAKEITGDLAMGHHLICGPNYLDVLNEYDVVFKSPGIVLPCPINEYSCLITCQADLFLQVYGKQTIGITGTKGKSTTSSLLYHILQTSGKPAIFGGNIGIPILDLCDQIKEDTLVVFELSCHQLEYAHYSPKYAIFLNLYEDHLDHYGSVEKYWWAKQNLYRNQKKQDKLYCNPDFLPREGDCQADITEVSITDLPFTSFDELDGAKLRGSHNLLNAAFVYDVCQNFGISDQDFIKGICTFKTLAHRLEFIGNKNGVDYYDDSISTTVESAISAIKAISNTGTIILGGMDRGIDYNPLIDYLLTTNLDNICLMYDSGKLLYDKLQKKADKAFMARVTYIPDLAGVCSFVLANAKEGSAVLLSPAAASYGPFKNFEQRGDFFKEQIFANN